MHITACSPARADEQRHADTPCADEHQTQVAFDRVAGKSSVSRSQMTWSRIRRSGITTNEMRLLRESALKRFFQKTGSTHACRGEDADFVNCFGHEFQCAPETGPCSLRDQCLTRQIGCIYSCRLDISMCDRYVRKLRVRGIHAFDKGV